ncbi:hypothetical protein HDV06_005630 [Boothiomyces sp. JEL0866]|nr:hypothetical protein HDV06_005630 [Boothiomyces sp. JEL0866]
MLYPDSTSSVSPEFQEIATEYYSQFPLEIRTTQLNTTHKRTASFEPYDVLFGQIKDAVNLGLKVPAAKKSEKIRNLLQSRSFRESDSEDVFSDDLNWESESDSECDCESLIEFRTDGEFASIELAVEIMTEKLEEVEKAQNQVELDQHFQNELLKSSMLADFHERYILKALERKRLDGEAETAVGGMNLAQSVWKETLQANPMQFLENIGRNLPSKEEDIGLTATIHEMEELVEISESSKEYSKYIPSFATRLNVDDKLFEKEGLN